MHVPAPTIVIVAPFAPPAVHTRGVVVVNATVRSDDAVAVTVIGACVTVTSARAANVIVWSVLPIPKLCSTGAAAL